MDQMVVTEKPVVTQEMYDLFDEFTHSTMQRRVFMRRLAKIAGSTTAAAIIAPMLTCNYAYAKVAENDPRIQTRRVSFKGATAMNGYLIVPKGATKLPAIVVTHENRGLNPHIEDVARRFALEGFVVLAPDFLTPFGGTKAFTEDEAPAAFAKLDPGATVANGVAAVAYMKSHANSTGKVGTVGYCWGGGMSNQLAVNSPDLVAGVVYYGIQPKPDEASKIKAKMMLHYAGEDARINERMDEWKKALDAAKVVNEQFVYPGKQHGFNNDTSAARYDDGAAKLAWERTVGFFKKHLT